MQNMKRNIEKSSTKKNLENFIKLMTPIQLLVLLCFK